MDPTDVLPENAPVGEVAPEQPPDNTPPRPQPIPAPAAPAPAAPAPAAPAQIPAPPSVFEPAPEDLIAEIQAFELDSVAKYKFNNFWDVVLSVVGILLAIAIVGAGFLKDEQWISAVLGAIVGAVVTAQKAFPFGSRAAFYRILIGQARNLLTRASQKTTDKTTVINTLSSLRMDYAQQLPRGSSAVSSDPPPSAPQPNPPKDGGPKPAPEP